MTVTSDDWGQLWGPLGKVGPLDRLGSLDSGVGREGRRFCWWASWRRSQAVFCGAYIGTYSKRPSGSRDKPQEHRPAKKISGVGETRPARLVDRVRCDCKLFHMTAHTYSIAVEQGVTCGSVACSLSRTVQHKHAPCMSPDQHSYLIFTIFGLTKLILVNVNTVQCKILWRCLSCVDTRTWQRVLVIHANFVYLCSYIRLSCKLGLFAAQFGRRTYSSVAESSREQ